METTMTRHHTTLTVLVADLAAESLIADFIEIQRSLDAACAPESIFVRDQALADRLDAKHAPSCGVWTTAGDDVPMLAAAGPDPLGGWCGVTLDCRVVGFTGNEVV
jgi:hypothetical protein